MLSTASTAITAVTLSLTCWVGLVIVELFTWDTAAFFIPVWSYA